MGVKGTEGHHKDWGMVTMRHAVNLHTTLGIQHQQANKQTTTEREVVF